jgi:hypothetical protein
MNLHVTIFLEPASTITRFNVEIKRRTISINGIFGNSDFRFLISFHFRPVPTKSEPASQEATRGGWCAPS